jgi:hypothetical protein
MTTAVMLAHISAPAPVAQSATRVPLGSDQGEDLYALWRSVFETSHMPAGARGDETHSISRDRVPQGDPQENSGGGSEHRTFRTEGAEGAADVYEPPASVAAADEPIRQDLLSSGVRLSNPPRSSET